MACFTRSAFDLVNGYPHTTGLDDQILDRRLKTQPDVEQASPDVLRIDELFYIYRWGVSPVHLSGAPSIEAQYQRIGQMPVEQGQYFLRPHWKEDYVRKTRNAIGISPFRA